MRRGRRRRNAASLPRRASATKFFSLNNAKARKGFRLNCIVAMLYMQPANRVPGLPTVCPHAGACREPCLNFSGHGQMDKVQAGRAEMNRWYFRDRSGMVEQIKRSIALLEKAGGRWARKPTQQLRDDRRSMGLRETTSKRYKIAIRLNATSDLPWERLGIMQSLPRTQFYDYTKNADRMMAFLDGRMPRNYHLTFSMGGIEDHRIPEILEARGNVTMVFNQRLPQTYGGRFVMTDKRGKRREVFIPETRVINGDEDDLRFLDPQEGVLVGLHYKPPRHVDAQRAVAESGLEGFVFDPDAWPAQRLNPRRRRRNPGPVDGVAFRFGCGGYNVVVEGD